MAHNNQSTPTEYKAPSWQDHVMGPSSGMDPFHVFESRDHEVEAVQGALEHLSQTGFLAHSAYDHDKYQAFIDAVKKTFEIPWTGISPRARRTIYAINAVTQPKTVVCAGIFCGYTFVCNAGAAIGPGKCFDAKKLVGLEILPSEAERATRNIENFAAGCGNTVLCRDAAKWLEAECDFEIELLYIDAKSIDFDPANTEPKQGVASVYFEIISAAIPNLADGAIVLAHNSVNAKESIADYLALVRSEVFGRSVNLVIDDAGLEVSRWLQDA